MSTTVVINEVPKFSLSVRQGDGVTVALPQSAAPALTLSMSGPQGPTGPVGAAGPNSVTTSTSTTLTGYVYGNGTNIAGATAATDAATASTLVRRDSGGSTSFYSTSNTFSVSVGSNSLTASPTTGAFLFFNASSQYAVAVSSPTATANRNIEFPNNDGVVSLEGHTHVADDITDLHRLFVQNTAPTVAAGTPYVWFNTSGGNLQVLYDDGL